jgi:hypothetical protein
MPGCPEVEAPQGIKNISDACLSEGCKEFQSNNTTACDFVKCS